MSCTEASLEEPLNKRHCYPVNWLVQNRNNRVPSYYEKELEECKILHKTVTSGTEAPSGKGEKHKTGNNEEVGEEPSDMNSPEECNSGKGNGKVSGSKHLDGKPQDRKTERKPKQEAATGNPSRCHNERTKHKGTSFKAETVSSWASSHTRTSIPPGVEKVGTKSEEAIDKQLGKSHLVGPHQEKGVKEDVFQATFLEKGGKFAKGPDEKVNFQRPQSLLLKEWNQNEVIESLSFLVDLSFRYFIETNVRKLVESVLAVVERNLEQEENNRNSVSQSSSKNVSIDAPQSMVMSNSSEVTVEDIERIVLTPGLLMNMPYEYSKNSSSAVKQSRVTRWMEELDATNTECASLHDQKVVGTHASPTQKVHVELEKDIDSFLASVRRKTLSKKNNVHQMDNTEARVFPTYSPESIPKGLWKDTENHTSRSNASNGKAVNFIPRKHSFAPSTERNEERSKSWKPAETPSIALIDPAICDAKIKTSGTCTRVASSPVPRLDSSRPHTSPTWSSPTTLGMNNGFHSSADSSHLLMNLLGAGWMKSNNAFQSQEDSSSLEKPMNRYSSSVAACKASPTFHHHKRPVYAEELEQALIKQTLSRQEDASRTDSSVPPLLKDSVGRSGKSFM